MPRYRRVPLTPERERQAALTSVAVGLGAAAATWVVARLLLSRDPLSPRSLKSTTRAALPAPREDAGRVETGARPEEA